MTDESSSTTPKPFPLKAKVILSGLKAADFNDKVGEVRGPINGEGRQSVYVEELDKTVALKLVNLKYQPRELDSLSNKELKNILRFKQSMVKFQGMDKSDLKSKLAELSSDGTEIAEWLAQANAGGNMPSTSATSSSSSNGGPSPMDQFDQMNPEMLKQQAQMMRSMPPATIRSMNPQLAHMSDAQIQQAAAQMEMMASNPAMMQQAKQQMKSMTPAQKEQYQKMMAGGAAAPAAPRPTGQTPQEQLANMSPEQLRQQAQMMRSMPPDTLRSLNPQLANMTDAQIQQAATQMEMMAGNPELMKMASDQMKNLSPQQMEEMMKNGGAGADLGNTLNPMAMGMGPSSGKGQPNMTMDPTKMLETMEPKQIKEMMNMLKSNPDALAQMAAQSGMPKEGLEKTLSMFDSMTDEQLESSLKTMAKVQKATAGFTNAWKKGNDMTGGNLKTLLIIGTVVFVVVVVLYFLGGESPEAATKTATKIIKENVPLSTPGQEAVPDIAVEDEFSEL